MTAWDGVPPHPERDGSWWISSEGGEMRAELWIAGMGWVRPDPMPYILAHWRIHGPCLTPAEVAAAIRDAEARGMERAAGIAASVLGDTLDYGDGYRRGYGRARYAIGTAIRAAAAALRGGAGDE